MISFLLQSVWTAGAMSKPPCARHTHRPPVHAFLDLRDAGVGRSSNEIFDRLIGHLCLISRLQAMMFRRCSRGFDVWASGVSVM